MTRLPEEVNLAGRESTVAGVGVVRRESVGVRGAASSCVPDVSKYAGLSLSTDTVSFHLLLSSMTKCLLERSITLNGPSYVVEEVSV